MILKAHIQSARDPTTPNFWFVMSMGLLVDFVIAYRMNWWLAAKPGATGLLARVPAAANQDARGSRRLVNEDDTTTGSVLGGISKPTQPRRVLLVIGLTFS
jgi:hypothetical protein